MNEYVVLYNTVLDGYFGLNQVNGNLEWVIDLDVDWYKPINMDGDHVCLFVFDFDVCDDELNTALGKYAWNPSMENCYLSDCVWVVTEVVYKSGVTYPRHFDFTNTHRALR